MKQNEILYQIKSLEKMIIRALCKGKEIKECDMPKSLPVITPTQMQIIEYMLNHINEDVNQRDLEEVLKLRRATVSGVLQTMEKNKLIERVVNTADTRAKKIILNEKAKEVFIQYIKRMEEVEAVITKDIAKEDLETFSKVLETMKNNIKES